eukprot:588932-Rhodomonas_salina.3
MSRLPGPRHPTTPSTAGNDDSPESQPWQGRRGGVENGTSSSAMGTWRAGWRADPMWMIKITRGPRFLETEKMRSKRAQRRAREME